jgi:hypothetical protein
MALADPCDLEMMHDPNPRMRPRAGLLCYVPEEVTPLLVSIELRGVEVYRAMAVNIVQQFAADAIERIYPAQDIADEPDGFLRCRYLRLTPRLTPTTIPRIESSKIIAVAEDQTDSRKRSTVASTEKWEYVTTDGGQELAT